LKNDGINSGTVYSEHNRQCTDSGPAISCDIAYVPHDFISRDHGKHINKGREEHPVRLYMRAQHRKNQQTRRPSKAGTKIFDNEHVFKPQMRLREQRGSVIEIPDGCAEGDQSRDHVCRFSKERQHYGDYSGRVAENLNRPAFGLSVFEIVRTIQRVFFHVGEAIPLTDASYGQGDNQIIDAAKAHL